MPNIIDLTGQTFGRLTVIERVCPEGKNKRRVYWRCKCSCGNPNDVIVLGDALRRGHAKSCGCLCNRSSHSLNKYIVHNDYVECYDFKGRVFFIDVEDLEKIKPYKWTVQDTGYVRCLKSGVYLHNFIKPHSEGKTLDHINRVRHDNRKSNLRECVAAENGCNRGKLKSNTSGVIGVSYCVRDQVWSAQVYRNNKKIYCGNFHNKEEAIVARLKAEKKYYGEFAPQKHLFTQYGIE